MASTAPAHDAVIEDILAVAPRSRVRELDAAGVRARCDSPRFRRGLFVADDATVQPARLALGLRARVLEAGVAIHERSRVRALHADGGGVVAECAGGRVRAGAAVLAVNAATRGVPAAARPRLGHLVAHRADRAGARRARGDRLDGRRVRHRRADVRALLPHDPRRPDRRSAGAADGWRPGARLGGRVEVDADVAGETHRHLVDDVPGARGPRRSPTPGAARSTSRRATCRRSARSTARRSTTRSASPATASARRTWPAASSPRWPPASASDLAVVDPEPARVPPEPFAWVGRNARAPCLFT